MHLSRDTLPCNQSRCKGWRHSFYPPPPQHKNIHIKHVLLGPRGGDKCHISSPSPTGSLPLQPPSLPRTKGRGLLIPAARVNACCWLPGWAGCCGEGEYTQADIKNSCDPSAGPSLCSPNEAPRTGGTVEAPRIQDKPSIFLSPTLLPRSQQ